MEILQAHPGMAGGIVVFLPPEELMRTLTDRKIAEQERVTYETQRQAQSVRQELQQATALADTQARVVDAERKVVPDIVAGGGADGAGSGLLNVLLGNMLYQDRVSHQATKEKPDEKPDPRK